MTAPAIVVACRAMNRQYAITDDARIKTGAFKYLRSRDLSLVMGRLIPAPNGNDPEWTRRAIAMLEEKMSLQHPYARLRRRMIEIALAGERLILKRQLADGDL